MTEDEWLACAEPDKMLDFLRRRPSERKLRLLACACCRRIWHLFDDERSRTAVEIAERYADGLVSRERLVRARDEAREAKQRFVSPQQVVAWRAAGAAQDATRDTGRSAAMNCIAETPRAIDVDNEDNYDSPEFRVQAVILKCIFGNPFRPPPPLPPAVLAWNDATVRRIAAGIYDERHMPAGTLDGARLAILADALLDAGCEDDTLIRHCREPGPHVRGCWTVDLILGKE